MYTQQFYQRYLEHLQEPLVRKTHDEMFRLFGRISSSLGYLKVVDLGCGTGEFCRYYQPLYYVGVDESEFAGKNLPKESFFVQADYKDLRSLSLPFQPTVLVSIFSTELTFPALDKYDFYESLFKTMPTLSFGLVSGAYYSDRMSEHKIVEKSEAGEFTLHQTLEDQSSCQSDVFHELRHYRKVPSKLWGPNLVEVWKFFIKATSESDAGSAE